MHNCNKCEEGHVEHCNGRGRVYIRNIVGDATWMTEDCELLVSITVRDTNSDFAGGNGEVLK